MATYQGPVRPNESESKYRETGKTEREKKEDLYVNIDDISKPDGKVMTREETGLDKPTTYTGGGRSRNRKETTQTTQPIEVKETPQVIKEITKPQPTIRELYKQKQDQLQRQQSQQPKPDYLSVVHATSKKKEFEEYIKDKNPVRATKEAVIETVTSELSKREKGQNLFGKPEVKTGIGLGLYFVPVLGQALLIGEGIGQFTKAGRTEAKQIGEEVKQKTGLPKEVGEYGTFALAATGVVGGAAKGITKIAAKTAKYDTTFVGTTTKTAEGVALTESKAVTTESNLFFTKQYRSTIQTTTKVLPTAEETSQTFVSVSRGATAEVKPIKLPYTKVEYTKPQPFLSAEVAVAQKGEQELTRIVAVGKSQGYKKPVSYYANLGYAKQTGDYTYYVGRGRILEKIKDKFKPTNKIGARGIIKEVEQPTQTFIISDLEQVSKTTVPKALVEQQQKSAIVSAIKSTKVKETPIFLRPPARKALAATAQEEKVLVTTQAPSTQPQKVSNKIMTVQAPTVQQQDITKTETKTIPKVIQNIKEIEVLKNRFTETVIPKEIIQTKEATNVISTQRQTQSLSQKERQRLSNLIKPYPVKPVIKPFPLVLPAKRTFESKSELPSRVKAAYSVIIKRRGKEVEIGKALPLGKAKKLGITSVLGSLARSYKLKEAGTTVEEDIYYNEPIGVFRPSKVGAYRVQKSKFALSSSAERREIQMFKRQKSRRSNWL